VLLWSRCSDFSGPAVDGDERGCRDLLGGEPPLNILICGRVIDEELIDIGSQFVVNVASRVLCT
jgi:hypothetical protein